MIDKEYKLNSKVDELERRLRNLEDKLKNSTTVSRVVELEKRMSQLENDFKTK
jgi:polyhydroxyalkanoate synthesis regulator phasin